MLTGDCLCRAGSLRTKNDSLASLMVMDIDTVCLELARKLDAYKQTLISNTAPLDPETQQQLVVRPSAVLCVGEGEAGGIRSSVQVSKAIQDAQTPPTVDSKHGALCLR